MTLPGSVRDAVGEAVERLRPGAEITAVSSVGGGCINHGARVDTSVGERFFLKWNPSAPSGMFDAEADGLRALRAVARAPRSAGEVVDAAGHLRIPEPYETGGGGSPDWLLMEWIDPGASTPKSDDCLGRGLARLHSAGEAIPGDSSVAVPWPASVEPIRFGWHADNWIGSLPQSNRAHHEWSAFWREERIGPQLRRAREGGHFDDSLMDDLMDRIPAAVRGVDTPSLLHGDLWSGNAYTAEDGSPVVIDPAVYLGDAEVDLAMTELFGGFRARFYDAYRDIRGISQEYASHRRDLYQLYYLLVHVNLFGRGYVAGSRRAAERVLAALG